MSIQRVGRSDCRPTTRRQDYRIRGGCRLVLADQGEQEDISVFENSMSVIRDSPHPDPLPKGEGTAKFGREQTDGLGFANRLWTILPLPLGEGRGEGNLRFQWSCAKAPDFQ